MDIDVSLAVRIAFTVALGVLLVRAASLRISSYRWQRHARTNGLRLLVTKDRLARLAPKTVIFVCLVGLIVARLTLPIHARTMLGDGLVTVITCALAALLWIDSYYSAKLTAYDRHHGHHHE